MRFFRCFFKSATIDLTIRDARIHNYFTQYKLPDKVSNEQYPNLPILNSLMDLRGKKTPILVPDSETFRYTLHLTIPVLKSWGMKIEKSPAEIALLSDVELLELSNEWEKEYEKRLFFTVNNYCQRNNLILPKDSDIPTKLFRQESEEKMKTLLDIKIAPKPSDYDLKFQFLHDIVRKAFQNPLNDPWNGLPKFGEHVAKWARSWSYNSYFAPYTALVQSSGTGKSKMLYEYGKATPVIYVCTRPLNSSGYPPRTPFIADILDNPSSLLRVMNRDVSDISDIVVFSAYLAGSMKSLCEYLKSDRLAEWNERQFTGDKVLFQEIESNIAGILFGITDSVESDSDLIQRCHQQIHFECDRIGKHSPSTDLPVLFAFDEASSMVKPGVFKRLLLHSLRYALSMLPDGEENKVNFLGVLLDTLTKLSNFHPPSLSDPSLRFVVSNRLMDAYYEVNNWNLSVPVTGARLTNNNENEKLELFLMCGRPLWRSYGKRDVIEMAQLKLVGGSLNEEVNENSALAIAAARFNVKIAAGMQTSSELCKSHLGVCYYANRERDEMFIGYPSEPIVGLAAQQLMANNPCYSMEKIIPFLVNAVKSGLVAAGERGELVHRLLISNAYDKCAKKLGDAIVGVTLEQFLKALFSEKAWGLLNQSIESDQRKESKKAWETLKAGTVAFTQHIQCDYTPALSDLNEWFARSAIGMGKNNQHGIDAFLNIHLNDLKNTACLMSVKNVKDNGVSLHERACYTSSQFFSGITKKVTRGKKNHDFMVEAVQQPYLVLSMNINAGIKGNIGCYQLSDSRKKSLVIELDELRRKKRNGEVISLKGYMKRMKDDSIVTVIPNPEKQLVVGASGWKLDGKSIYNLTEKEEFWLKKLIDATAKSKDLVTDDVLRSSMLCIELPIAERVSAMNPEPKGR